MVHTFLEHWAPLWDVLVAAGTGALAGFTYWLARKTRDMTSKTAEAIGLEEAKFALSFEPMVWPEMPVPTPELTYARSGTLELRNGGAGVALDVRGYITWDGPNGDKIRSDTLTVTIAGGAAVQTPLMPKVGNWKGAAGELRYNGLSRQRGTGSPEWVTQFEFDSTNAGVGCRVTNVLDVTRPSRA